MRGLGDSILFAGVGIWGPATGAISLGMTRRGNPKLEDTYPARGDGLLPDNLSHHVDDLDNRRERELQLLGFFLLAIYPRADWPAECRCRILPYTVLLVLHKNTRQLSSDSVNSQTQIWSRSQVLVVHAFSQIILNVRCPLSITPATARAGVQDIHPSQIASPQLVVNETTT